MSDNNHSLRQPESITTLNELEVARRKAEINASHDRLLLANNLTELRQEGPSVLLKNVVLPVVGVGIAIWGVSKIVGSLTRNDERSYYVEPYEEDVDQYSGAQSAPNRPRSSSAFRNAAPAGSGGQKSSFDFAKYLPAALMIGKMGVGYMEKNGRPVPQFIHDLLSGPGTSRQQPPATK